MLTIAIRLLEVIAAFFRKLVLDEELEVAENSMIRAAPLSVKMLASPWKMIQANNRTNGTWVIIRKTWESKNKAVTLLTWGFMSWNHRDKTKLYFQRSFAARHAVRTQFGKRDFYSAICHFLLSAYLCFGLGGRRQGGGLSSYRIKGYRPVVLAPR